MTDGYAAWRMPKGIKHLGCMAHARPDKDAALRNVRRLLKPGGEFFFSDVYADRRVPKTVRGDAVLCGECLGGALYWNDFLRLAHRHQFADPRLFTDRPLAITDPVLTPRVGNLRFFLLRTVFSRSKRWKRRVKTIARPWFTAAPSPMRPMRPMNAGSAYAMIAIAIAIAMAAGGLLFARRVAETMSKRVAVLRHAEGAAANFITAGLVMSASVFGLPVPTTHVSVGSIAGVGASAGSLS